MFCQKQFWMFCVLLMIITLLSSFGGGIRYRENFLEEVYDLNDITSELKNADFYPVNIDSKIYEESMPEKIEEEIVSKVQPTLPVKQVVPSVVPTVPTVPTVPVSIPNQPTGIAPEFAPYNVIEAYTGESYASFKK